MNWRLTAAGIWLAVVVVGVAIILQRAQDDQTIAKRQMPMNHLIQTSDLKKSQGRDLVAKYLRMNVVPGELIKKDDVASVPLLGTDSYPWFAVQTPAEAAHKDVDPKSKGQICDEGTALSPAEVVALFCNGGQQDNFCVVLVRVAPTDATKLSAVLSAKPSPGNLLFKPACGKDHK